MNILNLFTSILIVFTFNIKKSYSDEFKSRISNTTLDLKRLIGSNAAITGFYKGPLQNFCALRIVGGVGADLKYVPYQVNLVNKEFDHYISFCGGALITWVNIMSAAHCFVNADLSNSFAVAGSLLSEHPSNRVVPYGNYQGQQYRKIVDVFVHDQYNDDSIVNDISIVQINKPFVNSSWIIPIRLHTYVGQIPFKAGESCLISGYGYVNETHASQDLRMACVPLLTKRSCGHYYSGMYLRKSNFCAGGIGVDSCMGDSGGPITCSGVLVGIISFGSKCGSYPAVYTRVLSYTSENTQHLSELVEEDSSVRHKGECAVIITISGFLFNKMRSIC